MKKILCILSLLLGLIFFSCDCGTESKPEPVEPTVLLTSSATGAAIGEIVTANLGVKGLSELASIGVKITYDPYKVEIAGMTRTDTWLTSNGGTIQQMEFSSDNTAGSAKIVLSIFPTSKAVGDTSETIHNIAQLRVKAKSAGTATLTVSINNAQDSDLGIFNKSANLVSGVKTQNLSITVHSK